MQTTTHGQFFHIEAYSRQVPKKRLKDKDGANPGQTVHSIVSEAMRVEGFCDHVADPKPPCILFGCSPLEVEQVACEWASTAKDDAGHRLRIDGKCLLGGVISAPNAMTDQEWQRYKNTSLTFLQRVYGDRLRSVVEHRDEACRHMHFYCVSMPGEPFAAMHPGRSAIKELVQMRANDLSAKAPSVQERAAAYKAAMAALQDDFFDGVARHVGLGRKGPQGHRLSRKEYFALKENFRNASQARDDLHKAKLAITKDMLRINRTTKLVNQKKQETEKNIQRLKNPIHRLLLMLSPLQSIWRLAIDSLPSSKKIQHEREARERAEKKLLDQAANLLAIEQQLKISRNACELRAIESDSLRRARELSQHSVTGVANLMRRNASTQQAKSRQRGLC